MKVPIGLNELGLIKKGFGDIYVFHRNGGYIYEREFSNGIIMTWLEFKTKYATQKGNSLFHRSR